MDGLTIEQRKSVRAQLLTGFLMERESLQVQHRVFKRLMNLERLKEIEASLVTVEIAIDEATKIWEEIEHEGTLPTGNSTVDLAALSVTPNGKVTA